VKSPQVKGPIFVIVGTVTTLSLKKDFARCTRCSNTYKFHNPLSLRSKLDFAVPVDSRAHSRNAQWITSSVAYFAPFRTISVLLRRAYARCQPIDASGLKYGFITHNKKSSSTFC
jgi:hypothetical protein